MDNIVILSEVRVEESMISNFLWFRPQWRNLIKLLY